MDHAPAQVSDEKLVGMLENVFGLHIPNGTREFTSEDDLHYEGLLEHVFGLRLPSETVSSAYSIFIKEYKQN